MTTERHPLTGGSTCRECLPPVTFDTEAEAFEHLRTAHPDKFEYLERLMKLNADRPAKPSDLWTPGVATLVNPNPPGGPRNRSQRRAADQRSRTRFARHGRRF